VNAYVAEQNLERLRYQGSSIEERDIQLAKICLRKARHILSSTLDVFFYVAKTDSIVAASAPSGLNAEIEDGFNLLSTELQKVTDISFRPYRTSDKFLIETVESGSNALAYWCFVKIERALGLISIDIHHPGGAEAASDLMNTIVYSISICCHRVNQLILLRRLHRSRTASRFLIPPDDSKGSNESPDQAETETEPSPFYDGVFSCPIVYRTSFKLYHRCATNPKKVCRALEAAVLHIFAVSNRQKSYVYKDESGAVFYLGLSVKEGSKGADENDGTEKEAQIELLVYGVDKPGPSVTVQLAELLQKKLLTIAVDMLSAVLTKNPQYHWRQTDIDFVRSFDEAWNSLESEPKSTANDMVRTYTFPPSVFDPGLIVLYFRQNICGSTFFHPLFTSEWGPAIASAEIATVEDANLHFDETDLVVYFNTAPSKLDPSFQSESTLTRRGAELSRQTGSGIAIIEVLLLDHTGRRLRDLCSAIPNPESESMPRIAPESLRLQEASNDLSERTGDLFIQVRIVDTALNRNILHEWVKLSLEQVLTSWNVEKQLERMQRNLFKPMQTDGAANTPDRLQEIESICPGLPALTGLLECGENLPHPAILKLECSGVIRSSTVASVALELLEHGILDNLRLESKKKSFIDAASQICIIRSCRSAKPHRVTIEWDSKSKNAIVKCATETKGAKPVVKDSPIECPEYTVFFHSADYLENRNETPTKIPKLFEEVLVGFESSGDALESRKPLEEFKRQNPSSFKRSFVFMLSVKRNRRVLLAYNWNAKLFKSLTSRLKEKDASFLAATGQSVASLQERSLGRLAPPVGESNQRRPKANSQNAGTTQHTKARPTPSDGAPPRDEPEKSDYQRPIPRVKRPQMIRRPKLVGKSVEGSAMHAVARSRARASANRFRGGAQAGNSAAGAGNAPRDEPATRKSTVTGAARSATRPPRAPEAPESRKPEDKDLENVKNTIRASISRPGLVQQPSLRAASYRMVTKAFWPLKTKQDISLPVADFIFSIAPVVWFDVSEMLPVPITVLRAFLLSLGQTISAWTPGLTIVPIRSVNEAENAYFLIGRVRNVRNTKCCVAVKLSTVTFRVNGREKTVVTSDGRILTLPRRRGSIPTTQAWIENDGAGLNKLAADTHELINLQATLLDHAASMIERTMKSDGYLEYSAVLRLLKRLIDKYPLHPVIALKSNYKCYQATIVLRSYGDRFIDLFDGPTLFQWLASNLDKRNSLLNCGPNGLCFKTEIVVRASHSICFLSSDNVSPSKMKLNILCRSQKMVRAHSLSATVYSTLLHIHNSCYVIFC